MASCTTFDELVAGIANHQQIFSILVLLVLSIIRFLYNDIRNFCLNCDSMYTQKKNN